MEGGGGSAGGGGVLGAAREPRERLHKEEEVKGAGAASAADRKGGGAGGGMKFRVSARAPHGVGALLLIGGAAVVGAAVLAWRRSRRGKKGAERQRDRQPAKGAVLDGGVVEDGKGSALVSSLDQSNENLSAGNTEIGSGILDGKATEESHQIHKDNEIVADQLDSKREERTDQNSGRNPIEVNLDDKDKEHVQKIDQNSSRNHVDITTHDMCQTNEHVEKIDHVERIDHDSSRNPVEIMPEVITVCLVPGNVEKVDEDSSRNNIGKEIAQKDNKDVKASDESKLSISGPGIIFSKNNDESDGIQEAESMENTPTAQLMMHQEQLLDDMVTDTEEVKQGERTITDESELEQDEKKALAGLIELVSSPAVASLVKPAEKKGPEFPGLNETGMKIEQDYTNGELREHDMISKGGVQGGAIATMDRRSPGLAILALIFAMTIGITIIVRLYAPTRATKLQMDL
ncbi:hypothetical protein SEVIR_3G353700v4 [Setaria viridis]|uniref:Uncharacterized protein n=1 Tax=Setaria viridis TaxID=4556 RepID=A0A4U6VH53_SETVI|nr:uncharacterized protein LOC117847200 isoform X2 [Setaria viridis]TKW28828.1 hypothetical protein SEVIR_3G353700v2 [Setaria viridis]